ncbi:MAG: repeat protein, partial [Verrucomicrobiales bacterium]|nr:repeat protein [Verrucomicrobiales bacterium]
MTRHLLLAAALSCLLLPVSAKDTKDYEVHEWKKIQITDKFWSEGAAFGDFNKDGKMDVVSGPYWYEGPGFTVRHEYYPAKQTFKIKKADGTEQTIEGFEGGLGTNNAYSDN